MTANSKSLGPLPHWDLSNVYPGLESEPFQQAVAEVKTRLDDLDRYLDERRIARASAGEAASLDGAALAAVLNGYLDRMNALLRLFYTVRAYVYSFITTDSYNAAAKRLFSEMLGVRLEQQDVRFQGWLGALAHRLPDALAQDGPVKEHAFYLKETAEQSRYLMGEAEEALASELAVSGAQAWSKLQGTITSQLTVPFERDGKVEKLPMPALQNLSHDPDESIRRRAYEAELAAWETVKESLAAALNGVKGASLTLNQRRGRTGPLHAALDLSRIDRETLDAMLTAMRESFPVFRQYLKRKAQRLGKEALPWWDLFAPVGRSERTFTWPEARDFVVAQFGKFGERLARLAQTAFDRRWLDAEPRDGKRGGAFCMGVPGVEESRVLCNFDGSLDQVFTLAHELGHAFHNECMRGKPPLRRGSPMTLNETASIFCETIVTEAVLREASGPEEELAILETSLIGSTQVVVDIASRYQFETEVFERRAKAELSADEFCEIILRCQEAAYGDGIDPRHRHKFMWAWKPHYYYSSLDFYNYPYAFGLLFGAGLYALYQQRGPDFVPDYEALLASTGEATAADLAARFGINLRQPDFWRGSLGVIEKRIERYLEL
jgi:pepF/M3 family oligoendopeptidase